MQKKSKRTGNIIGTIVPSLVIIGSGVSKLIGVPALTEKLNSVGVGPFIPVLGIMEIAFAVLFILPRTMRLGFILLSCYFGGAMATDLSHGGSIVNGMVPLALVWLATFVRDRSVFTALPAQRTVSQ